MAAGYIYENSAKESARGEGGGARGYASLIIPGLSEVPRWCPRAREGCVRKRGTPSPICMLLYRCFVRGRVEVDIQIHGRRREGQGSTNR